jgi:hypothetical protein
MIHSLCMMPSRDLRMMLGFLVMAHLMVFGGFLVMTRGVPILFSRLLVLRRSLGGHGLSLPCKMGSCNDPLTAPTGGDTLHAQSCALCFVHVPWRDIQADLACDTVL